MRELGPGSVVVHIHHLVCVEILPVEDIEHRPDVGPPSVLERL